MIDLGYNTIGFGLRAVEGDMAGHIVFSTKAALDMAINSTDPIILICKKTTPEDLEGIAIASALVTLSGGLASHAAIVSRAWNKPCMVGLGRDALARLLPVIKDDGIWSDGICYPEGTQAILHGPFLYLKEPE